MRFRVAALAVILLAPAARSQSNAVRIVNGEYTRSHDYDLVHQRIVLSNFDWDSTSFSGIVTTTVVSRRAGLDSLILDEGALLRNSAVTDGQGRAVRTARHGDTLVVFPARPAGFGDTLRSPSHTRGKVDERARADLHHPRRAGPPAAAALEPGRGHGQPLLVPHLRFSQRQG